MKKTLLTLSLITPVCAFASDGSDIAIMILLYPILFIGILLVCRGIINWYYKINQRVKNQERIIELLESIEKKLDKVE